MMADSAVSWIPGELGQAPPGDYEKEMTDRGFRAVRASTEVLDSIGRGLVDGDGHGLDSHLAERNTAARVPSQPLWSWRPVSEQLSQHLT